MKDIIIFDFDGTLADTLSGHLQSWQEVLDSFGISKSPALIELLLRDGLDSETIARKLEIDENLLSSAVSQKRRLFAIKWIGTAKLNPFVKETVETLYSRGYILCIASTSEREPVNKVLLQYEIGNFFSVIVGMQDVKFPKPHPQAIDIVLEKLRDRLGLKPEQERQKKVVYVGDSVTDYLLSKAKGLIFILQKSPNSKINTSDIKPDMTIESFDELLALFP